MICGGCGLIAELARPDMLGWIKTDNREEPTQQKLQMNARSVPRETCILRRFLIVLPAGFFFLLFLHIYMNTPNNISLLRRLNVSLILAHRLQRLQCQSVLNSLLIYLDMAPSPGRGKIFFFVSFVRSFQISQIWEKLPHDHPQNK